MTRPMVRLTRAQIGALRLLTQWSMQHPPRRHMLHPGTVRALLASGLLEERPGTDRREDGVLIFPIVDVTDAGRAALEKASTPPNGFVGRLTPSERTVLKRIGRGTYSTLCLAGDTGMAVRVQAGVLGSLVRKGLVKTDFDDHAPQCGAWVELTKAGARIASETWTKDCPAAGSDQLLNARRRKAKGWRRHLRRQKGNKPAESLPPGYAAGLWTP